MRARLADGRLRAQPGSIPHPNNPGLTPAGGGPALQFHFGQCDTQLRVNANLAYR